MNESPVIYDLSVTVPLLQNKTDYQSDVGQRGIDQLQMPETSPASYDGGGGGGGSGVPSGYGPEEWTVYDGGVVTTRNFLTDNPD
jgi:hypothetical protein